MTIYQLAGIPYLWDPSICALVKAARRKSSPGQMSLFNEDPEFETKHPRGQGGKFSGKGGSPLPVLEGTKTGAAIDRAAAEMFGGGKKPVAEKSGGGEWVSRALAMSPRTQAAGISDLTQRVVSRLRAHQGDPGSRDEQIGRYVRLEAGRMTREDRRAVSQFGDHWGDVEPDLTPEQRLQTAAALIVQATGGDPAGGDEIALGIAAQMSVPTAIDTAGKIAYGVGVDMTAGASRYQGTEGKDGQTWHGHLKGDKTKDEHAADQDLARMLDDANDWDPEAMLSVLSDWASGLMEKGGSQDPVADEPPVDEVAATSKSKESRDPKPRNKPPFPGAMMTSTGEWVDPDEWDEIEGNI